MTDHVGADATRALVYVVFSLISYGFGVFAGWRVFRKARRDRDAARGERDRLREDVEAQGREIETYQREIDRIKADLTKYPERLNGLTQGRDDAVSIAQDLRKQLDREKALCKSEHLKRCEADRERVRLGKDVYRLNERIKGLKEENERLGHSLEVSTDVSEELRRVKAQSESLAKALHDCTGKFAGLSVENETLKSKVSRLEGRVTEGARGDA